MIWKKGQENTAGYFNRNGNRAITIMESTMNLVYHYVGLGDSLDEANEKVDQIGDYLFQNHLPAIMGYQWGITRQKIKFIAAVNEISEVTFPHFNEAAKLIVTNTLKQVVEETE